MKVTVHLKIDVSAIVAIAETYTRRGGCPHPDCLDIDVVERHFKAGTAGIHGIPHLCHAIRGTARGQPEKLLACEGIPLGRKHIPCMVLRSQREIIEISTGPAFSLSFSTFTEGANIIHEEFLAAHFKLGYRAPEFNRTRRAGVRNDIYTHIPHQHSMNIGKVFNIAKVAVHRKIDISTIVSVPETHTRRGNRSYPVHLDIDIVECHFISRTPGRPGIPHLR